MKISSCPQQSRINKKRKISHSSTPQPPINRKRKLFPDRSSSPEILARKKKKISSTPSTTPSKDDKQNDVDKVENKGKTVLIEKEQKKKPNNLDMDLNNAVTA